MTQPVPEEDNEALDLDEAPPDEHDDDLPDEADDRGSATQHENAESSSDQPSGG